ncbi:hypothetical protein BJ742DRAFT_529423 [Cladochytrium replicatum]|nr:hypothetical protein BJ742DRAFT_529423 [Cladochytrium replicatum]
MKDWFIVVILLVLTRYLEEETTRRNTICTRILPLASQERWSTNVIQEAQFSYGIIIASICACVRCVATGPSCSFTLLLDSERQVLEVWRSIRLKYR